MSPGEFWRRLRSLDRRGRIPQELEEEMSLQIALRAKELSKQGFDPEEAVYEARKRFGNRTSVTESSREIWGWTWVEQFFRDLRFAARSLGRNPLFTTVTITTFALGIGADTAIFSVLNAVLLRPLPYPQPDSIVYLNLVWKNGGLNDALTVPEFEFYRDHGSAFGAIAGFRSASTVLVRRGDAP
jgi:hypothetical protein